MLKKINWKYRKIHLKINFLGIYINDISKGWGFEILGIVYNSNEYSLLRLTDYLPNGAENSFYFRGDFLYLKNPLQKEFDDLGDGRIWNSKSFSEWIKIKYRILKFILT
jgi:hypothetical protein